MRKKYGVTLLAIGILALLFVGVLFIVECSKNESDIVGLWQNIALSVLCSIVASALFCMLQVFCDKDKDDEGATFRGEVNDKLNQIDEKLKIQNQLYDSGIVSIREKSFYDKDGKFWKDIIDSASNRLDLIGHSISKWFDEEYKESFVGKINSMLKDGYEVRIILSGDNPDMQKIRSVEQTGEGRHSLSKIENTCLELRQIARGIKNNKSRRRQLQVLITDIDKVTYMYIRTDQRCFISPYIYSATNSASSFLLELETKIDYSKCFERDFQEMLRDARSFLDLED